MDDYEDDFENFDLEAKMNASEKTDALEVKDTFPYDTHMRAQTHADTYMSVI